MAPHQPAAASANRPRVAARAILRAAGRCGGCGGIRPPCRSVADDAVVLGDFDADGSVGFLDFFEFADRFGQDVPPADPQFDLEPDGSIGFLDFFKFADDFGKDCTWQ